MSAPLTLSEHFNSSELECPHCHVFHIDMRLVTKGLEPLRAEVSRVLRKDTPLRILSGYRCKEHNLAIGGEQASLHVDGLAVDILCPKGLPLKRFYECAAVVGVFNGGGIGAYPKGRGQNNDFLHCDIRGKKARWARVDGAYVAIEQAFIKSNQRGKQ